MTRRRGDEPKVEAEFAHESLSIELPNAEKVERVWKGYWLPLLTVEGKFSLAKLKGELFDSWHLVNEARKVYFHVTGGITDDLAASGEGVIAMAERQVEKRVLALQERVAELEAELRNARP